MQVQFLSPALQARRDRIDGLFRREFVDGTRAHALLAGVRADRAALLRELEAIELLDDAALEERLVEPLPAGIAPRALLVALRVRARLDAD